MKLINSSPCWDHAVRAASVVLLACILAAARTHAQTLLTQFTFNDTGTSSANSVSGGTAANFFDATSTAADLHSVNGGGVSGQVGDRAFDNTASSGMGSGAVTGGGYGKVANGASVLSGLTSFTITGWYNSASNPNGTSARLINSTDATLGVNFNAAGGLSVVVDGTSVTANSSNYLATGKWIFFAVSYDGTQTASNVKFYYGDSTTAVSSLATLSINQGTVNALPYDLILGNSLTSGIRPFDGYMDDIRIYNGIGNTTFLNGIRLEALSVPEPSALGLLFVGCGILSLMRRSPFLLYYELLAAQHGRRGFTLTELLVVTVVIVMLAGLLLSAIPNAVAKVRAATCSSNLRQIGQALQYYATDNENTYPPLTDAATKGDWDKGTISPYLPPRSDGRANALFVCPSAKYTGFSTSGLSRTYTSTECRMGIDPSTGNVAFSFGYPRNRNTIASPSTALLMYDACQSGAFRYSNVVTIWASLIASTDLNPNSPTTSYIDFRHGNIAHFLYADGHIGAIPHSAIGDIAQIDWRGK